MFFRLFRRQDDEEAKSIKDRLEEIKDLLKSDSALSWRMAVIEADKLMDSGLKKSFMRGNNMGERLKYAVFKNPKMRKVWEAHILRNDLVHETDRRITRGDAERAVRLFEDGLKELKIL